PHPAPPARLYEAFPPEEAKRLADRLEIHHTPKHGSWLNQAEIELSGLPRQCPSRRIAHQGTLKRQIAGWEARRNAARPQIKWQFTTQDARTKLRSLYPSAHPGQGEGWRPAASAAPFGPRLRRRSRPAPRSGALRPALRPDLARAARRARP